ncbi:MAG: aminotransferase class III-fold pyridoxal phosphate-dependent enzyme [Gammaproteobacteria bacterium]|nr:aminotransferase class III-fold pyridoxal phosphate-dependent enzyme [Gammaproteobacteria bacterium]
MSEETILERRKRLLGAGAPLFYDEPVHIVRGEGVYLYDADGKEYLDVYNNVPNVGHCHPHVVEALHRQSTLLNVHTRYLHETVLDYAERLTALHDETLSMAFFTCSGTEANELALRMARFITGGQGIICSNATYHGNSEAVDELATLFHDGRTGSKRVKAVPYPESYRPISDTEGAALADEYAELVRKAIEEFKEEGIGFAGLLFCPIFANEGLPKVPDTYMAKAVALVREAGGLYIADEVQSGFARTGEHMWGYQVSAVAPDIATMGKPMGNGHPLAGLVARADLVNDFRKEVMYFNTFGGNPVQCAVGMAVLDVIEKENLQENSKLVGEYIRKGLRKLKDKHEIIGDVRGHGLFNGLELVKDRTTKEGATAETSRVVNELKERGILLSKIGIQDNILKMRPPLPFSTENADLLLSTLDDVLRGI